MLFSRYWARLSMAWLLLCPPLVAVPNASPNVVFITIDTLRADHLACYGYKRIHTPNIDALAASGTRFERAYTPVPVTLPAHTVIFTGTYPMLNGMHDFSGNKLGAGQVTLASLLQQQGYATGAVIGSAVLDSRFGLNRGFDFYYDHFDFNRLQESNIDEMDRPGNLVADAALQWLGKNYQHRFFLWMHLYDPHHPYTPPEPYRAEYKDRLYDGEIAFADSQAGRLLAFLKEKGLYQNTLIVLTGDHGESLGEHGELTHGFFIYNATLHVPVIIHLPGQVAAKTVPDEVGLADLMPTVLRALKLDVPSEVQGRDLLPLIHGKEKAVTTALYAETFLPRLHFNWSELRAVETEKYHFIEAPRPELYDVSKDPGETENLFLQKSAVGEELRAQLKSLVNRYSANQELAEKTGLDPALMERLKSLGYAGFSGGGSIAEKPESLPDPKDRIEQYLLISDALSESQHAQYNASSEKLKQVLKTDPNSVPVHYLLGLNYLRMGKYQQSIEEFQQLLRLSPDYSLAVYNLGLAYARHGDLESATETLKHALELDATNFSAAYNLGATYLRRRMVPESVAALRQATVLAPGYAAAHRALGEVLLYQGQADEGLAELRRAVELEPQDPAAHTSLAKALAAKGMNEESQAEMQKAQQLRPH